MDAKYTVSPTVFVTRDGRLGLLWLKAYSKLPDHSDLQIVLQLSIMENGRWGEPINITNAGIVLSYATDGERVYVARSPVTGMDLSSLYQTLSIETYDLTGRLLEKRDPPENFLGIVDAMDGKLLVQHWDGRFVILLNNQVETYDYGESVGFIKELNAVYVFNAMNGILSITGGMNRSITVGGDVFVATPMFSDKLFIMVQELNALRILMVRDEGLIEVRRLNVQNARLAKYSGLNGLLYVFPLTVRIAAFEGTLMGIIVPTQPPTPSLEAACLNGEIQVSWTIKHSVEYNLTKLVLRVYGDGRLIHEEEVEPTGSRRIKVEQTRVVNVTLRVESLFGTREVARTVSTKAREGLTTPPEEAAILRKTPWLYVAAVAVAIAVVASITLVIVKKRKK